MNALLAGRGRGGCAGWEGRITSLLALAGCRGLSVATNIRLLGSNNTLCDGHPTLSIVISFSERHSTLLLWRGAEYVRVVREVVPFRWLEHLTSRSMGR